MKEKDFPSVKGVIKKRTKNGQRYLLHGHDLAGKDVYITIPIEDTDGNKEYFRKIDQAKIKLNEKILGGSFRSIINQYFNYKQFAKNTRKNLRFLADFCMDDKTNQKLVEDILNSDLKTSSKSIYVNSIKAFFNWLIDVKQIKINNPANHVFIKTQVSHRTRCITDDELESLFDILKNGKDREIELVVRLAFFTGARISSIYALTPDSLKDGKIFYRNVKCKKEYDYPIPLNDNDTIKLYHLVASKGFMWSKKLDSFKNFIDNLMKSKFGKDQKGETLSIHSLRHSFASRAIQKGIPPEIVSKLLDHASINTTLAFYARHSQQQIDDAIEKIFDK